jgi:hypothetical protein
MVASKSAPSTSFYASSILRGSCVVSTVGIHLVGVFVTFRAARNHSRQLTS